MVDMATKLQTKKEKERERGKEGRKGERWRGERREETQLFPPPQTTLTRKQAITEGCYLREHEWPLPQLVKCP